MIRFSATLASILILAVPVLAANPTLQSLSPNGAAPGETITVNGSGFEAGSRVRFDGQFLPTQFLSAQKLRFDVPGDALCGSHQVRVWQNVPDGNGRIAEFDTPPKTLTVMMPCTPALFSLMPISGPPGTQVLADGDGYFKVTSGNPPFGFTWGSRVLVDGAKVPTTFVSTTRLSFKIPADAPCGARAIQVDNPESLISQPEHTSIALVFSVTPPCQDGGNAPPQSDFTVNPAQAGVGEQVAFSDASVDPDGPLDLVAWAWDFGDGAGANTASAAHRYGAPGNYQVTLTVTDSAGNADSFTREVVVLAVNPDNAPPRADFRFEPFRPAPGQDVAFIDLSDDPDGLNDLIAWAWDFGDGSGSDLPSPTHRYAQDGAYTVSLTVIDSQGQTDTYAQTIRVGEAAEPSVQGVCPPAGTSACELLGHDDVPRTLAFSPDGHTLASGGHDRRVLRWDVAAPRALGEFAQPGGTVLALAFDPGGQALAVGTGFPQGGLNLWPLGGGQPGCQAVQSDVYAAAFAPSGLLAFTRFADDHDIQLLDPATCQGVGQLGGHPSQVRPIAFSGDGARLISQDTRGVVKLWDVPARRELRTLFDFQTNGASAVAISRDGRLGASGDANLIKLWDLDTGVELFTLDALSSPLEGLAFTADGRHLISANWTAIKVWDVTTGVLINDLPQAHAQELTALALSPDGATLASSGRGGELKLWSVAGLVSGVPQPPAGLTIEQALDANENGLLDDDEVLRAVQWWVGGQVVPGTDQTISDRKMLDLIAIWIAGRPL